MGLRLLFFRVFRLFFQNFFPVKVVSFLFLVYAVFNIFFLFLVLQGLVVALKPEKEVSSLIKHDLSNIYSFSSSAVEADGYKDNWVDGYEGLMESFAGDLGLVVESLDVEG